MSRIFCIANQKGGVGKTTTTVNLAAGLARIGQRVLLVDMDPQGNATMGSGVDKHSLPHSVYDVLIGSVTVAEAVRRPADLAEAGCGYAVLGANRELAGAEVELSGFHARGRLFPAPGARCLHRLPQPHRKRRAPVSGRSLHLPAAPH